MTLQVIAYRRDPDTGRWIDLVPDPPPGAEMAGTENWRHAVWGSEVLRGLGLTVLPQLATTDVYAEGAELDQLAAEVDTLLADLPRIAAALAMNPETLSHRVGNILAAVHAAREVDGGTVHIG